MKNFFAHLTIRDQADGDRDASSLEQGLRIQYEILVSIDMFLNQQRNMELR